MPLVVSSLTGDASDVFDWTCSISPGDAQDLSKLLQMLMEHNWFLHIPGAEEHGQEPMPGGSGRCH